MGNRRAGKIIGVETIMAAKKVMEGIAGSDELLHAVEIFNAFSFQAKIIFVGDAPPKMGEGA